MDSNPSLRYHRPHQPGGLYVKKPDPKAGLTNAPGEGARRPPGLHSRSTFCGSGFVAVAVRPRVNGIEIDIDPVLLCEADQPTRNFRGRFANAFLELRDGRLRQIQRGTESGLRESKTLADAGDCVHGADISRTGIESQQSGCLLIMRPTYIVRACQQNP